MAKTTITNVNMSAADNGIILSWTEKVEGGKGKGTYDNCTYNYPQIVIQQEEDESPDDMIERAGEIFLSKWKEAYKSKLDAATSKNLEPKAERQY